MFHGANRVYCLSDQVWDGRRSLQKGVGMDFWKMLGCIACEVVWLVGHYNDVNLWLWLSFLAAEYYFRQRWWLTIHSLVLYHKSIRHRAVGKHSFFVYVKCRLWLKRTSWKIKQSGRRLHIHYNLAWWQKLGRCLRLCFSFECCWSSSYVGGMEPNKQILQLCHLDRLFWLFGERPTIDGREWEVLCRGLRLDGSRLRSRYIHFLMGILIN